MALVIKGGEQINDSTTIMKAVIEDLRSTGGLADNFRDLSDPEVARWVDYADKELAVLLFPNITRNMLESWEAFGYINKVPHFNPLQKLGLRMTGALAMRLANGKIKSKYNIEDERDALVRAVHKWTKEGLKGRSFHGGNEKPDLADVVVYGCLKSIEDFTTFSWLVGSADRDLLIWYKRMSAEIPESSCVDWQ